MLHLRSTVIGDAVVRTWRFLGHPTLSVKTSVGDWVLKFGMLVALHERLRAWK